MAGLCEVFVDRAPRDALARRHIGMVFDGTHQQIERVPRMWLDKFEPQEFDREVIDGLRSGIEICCLTLI